jgi:hypothetical protein
LTGNHLRKVHFKTHHTGDEHADLPDIGLARHSQTVDFVSFTIRLGEFLDGYQLMDMKSGVLCLLILPEVQMSVALVRGEQIDFAPARRSFVKSQSRTTAS